MFLVTCDLVSHLFHSSLICLRKRSESGPKLEELFTKLENRLAEYEDRSSKKFSDLNSKIGVMNSLLENHKKFLEELTEKKTKTSEEKVKNLFEKVYSQDSVCREDREENTEKFDQLQLVLRNIEHKFESEVGNVEEKFKSSIAIVLEELQGSISKVTDRQNRFEFYQNLIGIFNSIGFSAQMKSLLRLKRSQSLPQRYSSLSAKKSKTCQK